MEPYPSAAPPPEQAGPRPPAAVRTAALFMYAGAALSLASGIITAVSGAALRAGIHHAFPRYSPSQVRAVASAEIIYSAVYALVLIFLWLLVAWASRAGKAWARIIGSILFGLNTILLIVTLVTRATAGIAPHLSASAVLTVLTWVAGLGAVIMLWRPDASAYFTAGQDRP